jgi:hypothetical protein
MHSGLGGQHGGDANMAALMDSLHGWQLNGGNGGGPHHSMAQRAASMDGLGGMAAAQVRPAFLTALASSYSRLLFCAAACTGWVHVIPPRLLFSHRRSVSVSFVRLLQVMHSAQSGAYYEPKGIWGSQEAINNQAGAES